MIHEETSSVTNDTVQTVLSDDQQGICERLLVLGRVRSVTNENVLPVNVLRRWSIPLLVGPAGSGKGFVCEEVARRLGNKPYRRWEIGSWIIVANRSSGTTLEQIEKFIEENSSGCVIYLAGVDTLVGVEERNVGYHQARVGEVERLLDLSSSRPTQFIRHDGAASSANVLVIAGGRFAGLWGDDEPGRPAGAEAWRNADAEPLTNAQSVAAWLEEHSGIPVGILRRIATEPMILNPLTGYEADRVAMRLCERLPRSLDGIEANEFAAALRGPKGWRAVADVIERAFIAGHEGLSMTAPAASTHEPVVLKSPPTLAKHPQPKSTEKNRRVRLADRLGMGSHRSTLLAKARRLGLPTTLHLEALARARGYLMPNDGATAHQVFSADAWKEEFHDLELAVALLSPGLEYSEQAICRGSRMLLQLSRVTESFWILRLAIKERSIQVIRHIAVVGLRCNPRETHWGKVLAVFPRPSLEHPAPPAGAMPDDAIRNVLIDDEG